MMTISISTKWVVEIFPFKSPVPGDGDFGSSSVTGQFTEAEVPKLTDDSLGITGIAISRQKGAPDGHCQISMVGPLSPRFYVGAWAIVSSVSSNGKGGYNTLTRFIGQIENIDVSYNINDSANIYMQSSVKIREWSAMLRMLVRYDVMSIAAQLNTSEGKGQQLAKLATGAIGNSFGPQTQAETASTNKIIEMLDKGFNPYEFGNIILKLIGAMNSEDAVGEATNAVDGAFPNIATTAPFLPDLLLKRLGIQKKGAGKNPFEAGFVRVATGIQRSSIYADGEWNGIFKGRYNIDGLVKDYKDGYEGSTIKPITLGLQVVLGSGYSAWDLMTTQCDNSINEVFTDFLYEETSDGSIVGRPMIFIRNKPFMLEKIRSNEIAGITINSDLSSFSVYDNLPRHKVLTESIMSFRLNSTFLNSPNYIRISYQPTGVNNTTGESLALSAGLERLGPEMNRFGGNEYEATTIYSNTENPKDGESGGGKLDVWYSQLKELAKAWYSYSYRMASGILVLKENGIPLSVGNNVQFEFGSYKLVGHIEAINFDFQVEMDGLQTNLTTLTLTHIVQATSSGALDFVDMTHFGDLLRVEPTVSPTGTGGGKQGLNDLFAKAGTVFGGR